jgi:hypothetical protein
MPMPPFILRERQRLLARQVGQIGRWPSRVCMTVKPRRACAPAALDGPMQARVSEMS